MNRAVDYRLRAEAERRDADEARARGARRLFVAHYESTDRHDTQRARKTALLVLCFCVVTIWLIG